MQFSFSYSSTIFFKSSLPTVERLFLSRSTQSMDSLSRNKQCIQIRQTVHWILYYLQQYRSNLGTGLNWFDAPIMLLVVKKCHGFAICIYRWDIGLEFLGRTHCVKIFLPPSSNTWTMWQHCRYFSGALGGSVESRHNHTWLRRRLDCLEAPVMKLPQFFDDCVTASWLPWLPVSGLLRRMVLWVW